MRSKPQSTALTTFNNVEQIESNPLNDLRLSRQLTQRALSEGNVASACAFALASAKLLGPSATWAIQHNELLTQQAAARVADELIEILSHWLESNNVPHWQSVVGTITEEFSNQIEETT